MIFAICVEKRNRFINREPPVLLLFCCFTDIMKKKEARRSGLDDAET